MGGLGQAAVERLREYLRQLNPGARALLIAELERGLLRGDELGGAELVLAELRRSARDAETKVNRIGDAARLFFTPIEPFLVDDAADHKHHGRVARAALEPIWYWIRNTLMVPEARAYIEQVEQALLSPDPAAVESIARAFQDEALARMRHALQALERDPKGRRQFGVQLGTPRAYEDVETIVTVLDARDNLAQFGAQIPGHIKNLAGPTLDQCKALLDAMLANRPHVFLYALLLTMSRMAARWQLIRLATKASGSDATKRVAETPYAVAVTIALAELERMINELAGDLKSGRGIAVTAMLKDIHDAVRGLRTELDLSIDSDWGRRLAGMRAGISKLLSAEIDLVPGRVRRLIRPRPAKDIAPRSVINADEVAETEALVGFAVACRTYANEFAINEITQRVLTDLQQSLDTGTRALLDALRNAGDDERAFRRSQVEAAVAFCGKIFGQEYASLLAKAAEVAAQDNERKAARA